MTETERNLRNELSALTENWTIDDWRKVRNIDYLSSDYMMPIEALIHKLDRIKYYNTHRIVMPYSPPKVQMFIDKKETIINDLKSVLDVTKKHKKDVTSIAP